MKITLYILGVLLVITLLSAFKVVRQQNVMIIETLGKYTATWEAGLHFRIPIIQNIAAKISLKEQVADFPPQSVITKDNVMISINSVVYFQINEPYKNVYGVENYLAAIEKLSATTLRSIVGDMMLDDSLSSRDVINAKMLEVLDKATDPWGIKVNRVEVQDIKPPAQMQDAMEKQATAERNKRAAILTAEGNKRAAILTAEGNKQSAILSAEGNKQSIILSADAEKERKIKLSEAQAQATERIQRAEANALKMLKEAGADEQVLVLKRLEAMKEVANGRATKLVIPSDLLETVGVTGIKSDIFHDFGDWGEVEEQSLSD